MQLAEVNDKLDKLYFDGASAQRTISVEIKKIDAHFMITAWQCNMASMKTTDLKLPTVLRFLLDEAGCVIEAELMENFKGSQGIPCSYSYLNRILKKTVMGMDFMKDDSVLRNETMLHCRHIFELTAAAITFCRYCTDHSDGTGRLYESTKAYQSDDGLVVHDEYRLNGKNIVTEEKMIFSGNSLSMLSNGKLGCIHRLQFESESICDGEVIHSSSETIEDATGSDDAVMTLMKAFAGPWKGIGRYIGMRRNYYFTNFVPSSLYGVLIQAIALKIFPNNYNYFQHSLAGLQRSDDTPRCVGMALDMAELKKFYPEFREEDLFG